MSILCPAEDSKTSQACEIVVIDWQCHTIVKEREKGGLSACVCHPLDEKNPINSVGLKF